MSHLSRESATAPAQTLPQGLRRLAIAGFVAAYAIVLFYSIVPLSLDAGHGSDKVMHFLAYFGLMGLLGAGLQRSRSLIFVAIFMVLTGGGLELVQAALPHRQASWADMVANLSGIGVAAIILFSRTHIHIYRAVAARFR